MSHFCAKCQLALIFLYTLGKILWKNYVRFWKWNLKCTLQSAQNLCLRRSNLKFCIIFNMISFANAQGLVKIRLACSKALLSTISSSNIVTYSNGYIEGNKHFFFYKSRFGREQRHSKERSYLSHQAISNILQKSQV